MMYVVIALGVITALLVLAACGICLMMLWKIGELCGEIEEVHNKMRGKE